MAELATDHNKLITFVDFNEDTKRVMTLAVDVELMSMNALLANKNSSADSGFSAVADQLRGFSVGVIERATALTKEFSKIILFLTSEGNLIRRIRILKAAQASGTQTQSSLDSTIAKIEGQLQESNAKLLEAIGRANWLIEFIDRQCLIGGGLSRVGKIEATYGGSLEPMLFQIAKDVGQIINQIYAITSQLKDKVKVYLV